MRECQQRRIKGRREAPLPPPREMGPLSWLLFLSFLLHTSCLVRLSTRATRGCSTLGASVVLEPLYEADMDSVARLLSDAFDSPRFLFKAVSRMDFKAQLQDRQLRLVANGRNHTMLTLREEARGPVVGFLEMGLLSPVSVVVQGPDWVNSSTARVPTIGNLVIADSHRRRGLARVLMRAAEDAARGWAQGHIVVAVDPSNSAALALYRSLGYVEVDRSRQKIVKDLMQREVEFLVLVKRLEEGSSPG